MCRNEPSSLKTVVGKFECGERATVSVQIGSMCRTLSFYVVDDPQFRHDAILGLDCIKKFKLNQTDKLKILQRSANSSKADSEAAVNVRSDADLIEINLIEGAPTNDEITQTLQDLKF